MENIYPFKTARLNDCEGDLSGRWYIEFYVWNVQKDRLVRKRFYDVNNYVTSDERISYANRKYSSNENTPLVSIISHNIRAPLNSIVGFSNLISNSVDIDIVDRKAYGEIIEQNAVQLLNIIDDIMGLLKTLQKMSSDT